MIGNGGSKLPQERESGQREGKGNGLADTGSHEPDIHTRCLEKGGQGDNSALKALSETRLRRRGRRKRWPFLIPEGDGFFSF